MRETPDDINFDEIVTRFLTTSAAYFARELVAAPSVRHERRRTPPGHMLWPAARERRRSAVVNLRQYSHQSFLP